MSPNDKITEKIKDQVIEMFHDIDVKIVLFVAGEEVNFAHLCDGLTTADLLEFREHIDRELY